MNAIHKKIMFTALVWAVSLTCAFSAQALSTWDSPDSPGSTTAPSQPRRVHPDTRVSDTADTAIHWDKARRYQREQRFELARQHYLLALATCRTEETRDRLQRELQVVDLQLRTMR